MTTKIYIIENDVNILYTLQNKFNLGGLTTNTDTGTDCIETTINKIKAYWPNFIIFDLILPGINGFDLLAAIKADNELSFMSIFIFTNLTDNQSNIKSKNLGAEYYFKKTELGTNDFATKILKIIENRTKI